MAKKKIIKAWAVVVLDIKRNKIGGIIYSDFGFDIQRTKAQAKNNCDEWNEMFKEEQQIENYIYKVVPVEITLK